MEIAIQLRSPAETLRLFGSRDRHLRMLKERFGIGIVARDGILKLTGEEAAVQGAEEVVRHLLERVRGDEELTPEHVAEAIEAEKCRVRAAARSTAEPLRSRKSGFPGPGGRAPAGAGGVGLRSIEGFRPRTPGQQKYLELIDDNPIVFAIGPAGTGKTFLAVLKAVERLKSGDVHKIVLCRPAVEAGERLGFLPGDIQAKVNPYLRPLYDALNEILDYETVRKLLERDTIEIVPLAYMRGRTLNRAFIILDEGQNTTREQMKMFLTRMGEGSRIVVTGDITQMDLPPGKESGLVYIRRIMPPVPGISFHVMTGADIVRHRLVWEIVHAFERAERLEAIGDGAEAQESPALRRSGAHEIRVSTGGGRRSTRAARTQRGALAKPLENGSGPQVPAPAPLEPTAPPKGGDREREVAPPLVRRQGPGPSPSGGPEPGG